MATCKALPQLVLSNSSSLRRLCALSVSALSFLPSPNPLQYPQENHAHPIPPSPRNLLHPPRSSQNLPFPPPKTPRRLRQHPRHPSRIHLSLERKNRNRPRTSPPHQNHRPPPKIPRKGSPPPPLLRNPRIPGPRHLLRLQSLPPLALQLLQKIMADLQIGHSCFVFDLSCAVIPTGVAGIFLRAVRGAPATQRRDHGNPSTHSNSRAHANPNRTMPHQTFLTHTTTPDPNPQ
jgi:hypothetical protein